MPSNKIFQVISGLGSVIAGVLFLFIMAVYAYPQAVIKIDAPIKIPESIKTGTELKYHINYEKFYVADELISQELVIDGVVICSHVVIENRLPLGRGSLDIGIVIPDHVTPGRSGVIRTIFRYELYLGARIVTKTVETTKFITTK